MFAKATGVLALRFVLIKHCRHKSKLAYLDTRKAGNLRPITVGQLLVECVEKNGDKMAVVAEEQNRQLKFSELLEECDRFAAGLKSMGLKRGDKIVIWAPNFLEWHIASLGCARGGFTTVAINPALQANELEYALIKTEARCLIFPEIARSGSTFEAINEVFPNYEKNSRSEKIPSLEYLVCISNKNRKGMLKFQDVMDLPDKNTINEIKTNQDKIDTHEVCNIQFSSGTTGKPKAIPRTHYQIVNNSHFWGKRLQLHLNDTRVCFQVPMFHAYGLLVQMAAINFGYQFVYPSVLYNPEKALAAIEKYNLTVLMGTPTMLVDLIAEQSKREVSVKVVKGVTGGASVSPELVKKIKDTFKMKQVFSLYGMTEVLATFGSFAGDSWERETSTVGCLLENMEAKVVDPRNNVVPFGSPGELCMRGYNVLDQYIGDTLKTKEVLDEDGWLHTGDEFILTEDGYGRVVGRIKDIIIRGGENIHPQEIEDYLMIHDSVLEVAVVGLPHERLGEDLCACIIPKPGKTITLEEMKEFCTGRLAYFKIPARLEVMETMPKTASGKIQKFKLREQLAGKK